MGAESYGENYADLFDVVYGEEAPEPQIATLTELAGEGPVLELGVGTGRVAIPLAARGLEVHGVDASESMLAALAAKPGGDGIKTTLGALPEIPVDGQYKLVTCVDNTLLLLPSQDQQVQCLQNAADRLADDGVLVIETFAVTAPPADNGFMTVGMSPEATVMWAFQAEPISQLFDIREIILANDGTMKIIPFSGRGVSPAELDLMARLAGLRLRDRWSSWEQEPAGPGTLIAVSVYEKAGD